MRIRWRISSGLTKCGKSRDVSALSSGLAPRVACEVPVNVTPDTSLFDALGGDAAVLKLAQAWHARVLADEVVAHAFRRPVHPQHTERLAAYWAEAWGGPPRYS